MKTREASLQELIDSLAFNVRHNMSVRFRHFVREETDRRTEHGVRHRQYSTSKIYFQNNVPHVRYHGELHEITGTHVTLDGGTTFVGDIRIKSEHLKGF